MRLIGRTALFGVMSFTITWIGIVYVIGTPVGDAGENAMRWACGIMLGMILEHVYGDS